MYLKADSQGVEKARDPKHPRDRWRGLLKPILALVLWLSVSVAVGAWPSFSMVDPIAVAEGSSPMKGLTPSRSSLLPGFWLPSWTTNITHYLPIIHCNNNTKQNIIFGVQMYDNLDSSNGLDKLVAAGVKTIRWTLEWNSVEPTNTSPPNYNWTYADTQIRNAYKAGANLLVTIRGNPSWAAGNPDGLLNDPSDLAEFMWAAAERYDGDTIADAPGSPVVTYWELYNEPDDNRTWGRNGADYAAMLAAVYPAIKQANPEAQVVMGGLAHDWFEDQAGPFVRHFLDDVAAYGGGLYFDVMNFHYYLAFAPNWEAYGTDLIGKANYIKDKMAKLGLNKPLICGEAGWFSSDPSNDEWQSRYVPQCFTRSMAADLPMVIWFTGKDYDSDVRWGLLDLDTNPKPSYDAYKTTTRLLAAATYNRPLTSNDTGSESIEGYLFNGPAGNLGVVWATVEASITMPLRGSSVNMTDKYGAASIVQDGHDGVVDGWIQLAIGPSPVYLEQPAH